jgi:hypothetical protein
MSVSSPAPSCKSSAAPVGPTNTIPTSSGKVWLKLLIVTRTLPGMAKIVPAPVTVTVDGYGTPLPESGIVMGAVFENVPIVPHTVAVGVADGVGVGVGQPMFVVMVRLHPPARAPAFPPTKSTT